MNYFKSITPTVIALAPATSFAQPTVDFDYFTAAIGSIADVVASLVPLAIGIALVVFIWSVVKFIANAGDDEARKSGLRQMAWGIVGLFVIVSVWGLVSLLASIVGVEPVSAIALPSVPQ